jgi:serine/threonine-protein kinase RsbW
VSHLQRNGNLNEYEITQAAELETLSLFRNFIGQIGRQNGVAESLIYELKLAVDEACANIIQHGYAGMNPGSIILGLRCTPEKVVATVTDFGHPFEPSDPPKPEIAATAEEQTAGGFGLFFIYQTMDEVDYEITGAGNVLKLTKRLDKDG